MRSVIIPAIAGVLCRNKLTVADLVPGDEVSGYDSYNRRVAFAKIVSIEKLPDSPKVLVPITRFMTLTLLTETVILTPYGERHLADAKSQLTGYCYKDPKKLLIREVQTIIESRDTVETVRLFWDGPEYIWTDGVLVGEKVKGVTVDSLPKGITVTI
jgi:hypothetical protein